MSERAYPSEEVVNMNPGQGAALNSKLEQMQVRDSLRMYNAVVEICFRECAEDMMTKSVTPAEEKCLGMCVEKFMNITGRAGQRFGEFFQQLEKDATAAAAAEQN
eukprot:gene5643-8967_t